MGSVATLSMLLKDAALLRKNVIDWQNKSNNIFCVRSSKSPLVLMCFVDIVWCEQLPFLVNIDEIKALPS